MVTWITQQQQQQQQQRQVNQRDSCIQNKGSFTLFAEMYLVANKISKMLHVENTNLPIREVCPICKERIQSSIVD